MPEVYSPYAMLVQVLQFTQADVDNLLKEKELELESSQREWKSREQELMGKLDEQKHKYAEVSTEKLQSDEKVLRLQKSHEDMKYAVCRLTLLLDL